MNEKILKELNSLVEHLEYYNMMAPFPVYDTEYVGKVHEKIKEMKNSKIDYDKLPVAACKYCKSLFVAVDEADNNICMRCGSINEIEIFENIDSYLDFKNKEEENEKEL